MQDIDEEFLLKYDFSIGEMVVFLIEKFLFSSHLGVEIENAEFLGIVLNLEENELQIQSYDYDYYPPVIKYYQVFSIDNGRTYLISENKMKPLKK